LDSDRSDLEAFGFDVVLPRAGAKRECGILSERDEVLPAPSAVPAAAISIVTLDRCGRQIAVWNGSLGGRSGKVLVRERLDKIRYETSGVVLTGVSRLVGERGVGVSAADAVGLARTRIRIQTGHAHVGRAAAIRIVFRVGKAVRIRDTYGILSLAQITVAVAIVVAAPGIAAAASRVARRRKNNNHGGAARRGGEKKRKRNKTTRRGRLTCCRCST
jgi:hypothetical protein